MKISTLLYEKSCVDEASLSLALQIARENVLEELREASRERQKGWISKDGSDRHPNYDEHDWFQAYINNLINPPSA